MRFLGRVTLPVIVLAACAIAGAAAITALGEEDEYSPAELDAMAAAATPEPGEKLGTCPDEGSVAALKEANIAFGPCVPISGNASPEEQVALLGEAPLAAVPGVDAKPPESDAELCYGVSARTSDGEITAQIPCGSKIVGEEQIVQEGTACLRLTMKSPDGVRESRVACAGEQ